MGARSSRRHPEYGSDGHVCVPPVREGAVPPNDFRAEQALLNILMVEHGAIDEVGDLLRGEMFYSEAHRWIFEACRELGGASKPLDAITVRGWLRDRDRLAQVGGEPYLGEVMMAAHSLRTISELAKRVRDKWRVRQMILTCSRVAAIGYIDSTDVDGFVEDAESGVYAIAHDVIGEDSNARVGAVAQASFRRLAEMASAGRTISGKATGLERLDLVLSGVHDGDLTVVAARPGMGKTALVMQMGIGVAKGDEDAKIEREGVQVFSLEMPKEQIANRMACSYAGVDLSKLRSNLWSPEEWTTLTWATSQIHKMPIWIDDQPGISLFGLRSRVRRTKAAIEREYARASAGERVRLPRKLGLVIVDYIQLMTGDRAESREQEISSISRGLKTLAKEEKLAVIAVSQLNRSVETRADKRPMVSDLRESGAIEQDADNILLIYREDYYNRGKANEPGIAEVDVAKQRNGPTSTVKFKFKAAAVRFENIPMGSYATDGDQSS